MWVHAEAYEPENAGGAYVCRDQKILRPVAGSARGRVPGALPLAPAADDRVDGGGFRGSSADHVRVQPRPVHEDPGAGNGKPALRPGAQVPGLSGALSGRTGLNREPDRPCLQLQGSGRRKDAEPHFLGPQERIQGLCGHGPRGCGRPSGGLCGALQAQGRGLRGAALATRG